MAGPTYRDFGPLAVYAPVHFDRPGERQHCGWTSRRCGPLATPMITNLTSHLHMRSSHSPMSRRGTSGRASGASGSTHRNACGAPNAAGMEVCRLLRDRGRLCRQFVCKHCCRDVDKRSAARWMIGTIAAWMRCLLAVPVGEAHCERVIAPPHNLASAFRFSMSELVTRARLAFHGVP